MAIQNTRMQALRDWFGSSQLLDNNGEPLVLYHGATGDFKRFRPSLSSGEWGTGSYFTTDKDLASKQAESSEGGNVMPVYVRIENPVPEKVLRGVLAKYQGGDWDPQDVSDEIEGMGYDGVIVKQGDRITAIAYDPTQIKSALGNHGVYDRLSPDIRFSLADEPFQAATPDSVRAAIAQLVRVSADELAEGVGTIVVATSEELQASSQAEVPAQRDAAFQAWFADSKVVDEVGKPLVVYHGTTSDSDFSEFAPMHTSLGTHVGSRAQANDFAKQKKTVDSAHREEPGERVFPLFLKIGNPLRITDPGCTSWATDAVGQQLAALGIVDPDVVEESDAMDSEDYGAHMMFSIESAGYDGIVYLNRREGDVDAELAAGFGYLNDEEFKAKFPGAEDSYIVFRSEQIKSALGNRGTYDPRDPDIRHSLAAGAAGLDPRAQAFHDVATNTTVFLADRIPAGKEASVFLHETVHRHGRQALPEGRWGALVDQVKAWAHSGLQTPERAIHDAAAARVATAGVSVAVADEELFAYAVEEAVAMGIEPTAAAVEGSAEAWLQVVVESIQRVSDKLLGNDLQELGGQDLVDLAYALAQLDSSEHGYAVRRALQEAPEAPTQAMANGKSRDFEEGPMP